MADTKKRRGRPARQKRLPGMEEETVAALEDAAHTYYDAMMERVKLSEEEAEAKDNLIERMKEHGRDRYETADGFVVSVLSKSNVKMKKKKDAEPSANGDGKEE
jgi:hypothetical protein